MSRPERASLARRNGPEIVSTEVQKFEMRGDCGPPSREQYAPLSGILFLGSRQPNDPGWPSEGPVDHEEGGVRYRIQRLCRRR
jgi:hypothetical protein